MMKEMSKMHEEDAHDDNLIAMEISNQIRNRAQMRAAENADHSHILEPRDVAKDTSSPLFVRNDNPAVTATDERDNVTLLPSIFPPRANSGNDSAAARPSVQHAEVDNERDNVTLLPSILPPRAASVDDSAAAHPSVQHDEASIYTIIWLITAKSRSQKYLHVILSR